LSTAAKTTADTSPKSTAEKFHTASQNHVASEGSADLEDSFHEADSLGVSRPNPKRSSAGRKTTTTSANTIHDAPQEGQSFELDDVQLGLDETTPTPKMATTTAAATDGFTWPSDERPNRNDHSNDARRRFGVEEAHLALEESPESKPKAKKMKAAAPSLMDWTNSTDKENMAASPFNWKRQKTCHTLSTVLSNGVQSWAPMRPGIGLDTMLSTSTTPTPTFLPSKSLDDCDMKSIGSEPSDMKSIGSEPRDMKSIGSEPSDSARFDMEAIEPPSMPIVKQELEECLPPWDDATKERYKYKAPDGTKIMIEDGEDMEPPSMPAVKQELEECLPPWDDATKERYKYEAPDGTKIKLED
jgi:hypothetical protein